MLLKYPYYFSLDADRAPQLKALVGLLLLAKQYMKILTAILIVSFAALNYGKGETNRFDFNSRLGVVDADSQGGGLCLTIPNANLPEGSRIQIVSPRAAATKRRKPSGIRSVAWEGADPAVATAIVQRKLAGSCSRDAAINDSNYYFYSLALVTGGIGLEGIGIGLVGISDSVRVARGLASVDANGDGRREYFRMCTSNEGLHLTVWSGIPLTGVRRWHVYYYLGYDTPPTCTSRETR